MMKRFESLLAAAFLLSGCANVNVIRMEHKNAGTFEKMNASMKDRNVAVVLASGDSLRGDFSSIGIDTLRVVAEDREPKAMGLSDISSVSYRSRGLGAATYAGVGMMAALFIWSKTPEGPGIGIGKGVLHWAITIPFASAWAGYQIGRVERYVIKAKK